MNTRHRVGKACCRTWAAPWTSRSRSRSTPSRPRALVLGERRAVEVAVDLGPLQQTIFCRAAARRPRGPRSGTGRPPSPRPGAAAWCGRPRSAGPGISASTRARTVDLPAPEGAETTTRAGSLLTQRSAPARAASRPRVLSPPRSCTRAASSRPCSRRCWPRASAPGPGSRGACRRGLRPGEQLPRHGPRGCAGAGSPRPCRARSTEPHDLLVQTRSRPGPAPARPPAPSPRGPPAAPPGSPGPPLDPAPAAASIVARARSSSSLQTRPLGPRIPSSPSRARPTSSSSAWLRLLGPGRAASATLERPRKAHDVGDRHLPVEPVLRPASRAASRTSEATSGREAPRPSRAASPALACTETSTRPRRTSAPGPRPSGSRARGAASRRGT